MSHLRVASVRPRPSGLLQIVSLLVRSDLPGGAMLYDPAKRCPDIEHHFIHPRPGYLECERCRLRLIQRAVLPDGVHPTDADIEWLHHRQ
jgi:hypothetical protein